MFEYPMRLLFLICVPFLTFLFVVDIFKYKKMCGMVAGKNTNTIIPYFTEGQKWVRTVLYTIGFILIIFAFARPRWGIETINTELKGRDITILLDVSYSMAVPDVVPSRLDLSKKYISELLESGIQDRIGLMVFSSDSELLVPATYDYSAVSFFLESIYPGMVGKGGTDIGSAISKCIDSFDDTDYTSKAIILMTDGEDIENRYNSNIKKIKDSGIKIYTVGVGTKNGEPVPLKNSKGEIESYIKDNNGTPIVSRLDEKLLTSISQATNAAYLRVSGSSDELVRFVKEITGVKSKNKDKISMNQKKDQYPFFLAPALVLFCLGFILDLGRFFKKNTLNGSFTLNIFGLFFILSLINPFLCSANDTSSDFTKGLFRTKNGGFWGNQDYKKENYKKALSNYSKSIYSFKGDDLAKLYFNIGNTFVKNNDMDNAVKYYEMGIKEAKDDKLKSDLHYNSGLIQFKNKKYNEAVSSFKQALKFNSDSDDARYNFEVASLFLEKEKKNDENKKDKDKKNDDDNKNESKNGDNNADVESMLKALEQKEKDNSRKEAEKMAGKKSGARGNFW